MSIDTNLAEVLKNLQPTAEVILKGRETDFDNDVYHHFDSLLTPALRQATEHYHGNDFFLRNLRDGSKPWTIGQARAVANIYRRALRGEARKSAAAPLTAPLPTTSAPLPPQLQHAKQYTCYDCKWVLGGANRTEALTALYDHRRIVHGKDQKGTYVAPNTPAANASVEPSYGGDVNTFGPIVPVIEEYAPTLNIDLRGFLPARFAVEDNAGTMRFFIITELKRRSRLTGKFVWTKFRYANEYLEKGDRTVREQAGDTKKYIGKQRIQQPVYFGEHEELIAKIAANPSDAMERYGKEKGCCAYCGKSLTDAESRARGIGPDCFVSKHIPQTIRLARANVAASS